MAGVPTNFQALSNVLPTYNFIDVIAGTGYVNFYAGTTVDLKLLSNFTYYSDVVYENGSAPGSTANSQVFDNDFDVLLNRPMSIQGLGIINVPVYMGITNGSMFIRVYVRKWDGASETDIVTNDSRVDTVTGYGMLAIDVNVPQTHFKIGEYLRLTVQLYTTNNDVAAKTVQYAHDPKNRSAGWDGTGAVPSQLIFQCPVRLNL